MSQVIGTTRLAYSRVWHQVSAKAPHAGLTTKKAAVAAAAAAAATTNTTRPTPLSATTADTDVTPPSLGRLASRIAVLLMGKHKPTFDPSTDCGDYVVVTDCAALHTTGHKKWRKTYYRHNTRPGSLRAVTMDVLMEKHGGAEVLRKAVSGMLPKNRLRDRRLARLKAFEGGAHPYADNIVRFGGVPVGDRGWEAVVESIRAADKERL
ncbi:50S ribosomal protein L13 [Cordyceps militaris CM01]|uniref:50S ribosomal protein L13 n=1 Tax=Cordyceps militaris (strain CM01) TaxID=983644 RepID=G3JUA2_CORMM|nr:50S ribosomal protein L13 [Cordyceps militaris CM01]EGX87809.1 50S ribosomal protein L13 [Cordyceps militaris CM01]